MQTPQQFLQATEKTTFSACVVCLSRAQHDVHSCNSNTLWDKTPAYARCNSQNAIADSDNVTLCLDWNCKRFCRGEHKSKHLCSGCGAADHGAQECDRAE